MKEIMRASLYALKKIKQHKMKQMSFTVLEHCPVHTPR